MYYVIYTRLSEESEDWDPIINMDEGYKFKKVERKFDTMSKVNGAIKSLKLKEGHYRIEERND